MIRFKFWWSPLRPLAIAISAQRGNVWPQITATQAATRRSLRRGSCWLQVFTFGVGKSGFSMNQKCFLSHSCKHPILGILVFVISDWNAMIIGTVFRFKGVFFEHQILRSFPWGMSIMTSWPSLPHMDFSHLFLICSRSFTWLRTILSMFHGAKLIPRPSKLRHGPTAPRPQVMVKINLEGRHLSLPKSVVKRGVETWNSQAGPSYGNYDE